VKGRNMKHMFMRKWICRKLVQ